MQKQIFIFLCYNSCGMHVNQEEVQQEHWLHCQKEPQRDARLAEDEEGSRGCWGCGAGDLGGRSMGASRAEPHRETVRNVLGGN